MSVFRPVCFFSAPLLVIATALFGMAGCATVPADERARMVDLPLASTHADLSFSISTGSRQSAKCDGDAACLALANSEPVLRFAQQVQRVAGALQTGVQSLYPNLDQQVPGLLGKGFDVYVVDGEEPGSASSANGRIALNASLGTAQPYDEWLAFVIAREMGHVIARHHEENSAASLTTSLILNIILPGSGWLKSAISAGGSGIAAKSKQDVQALEADAIALKLLMASGFRLGDVSLALRAAPLQSDEGLWSRNFKNSTESLLAEIRRQKYAVASLR